MEVALVRGASAKLARDCRGSLDRKSKVLKPLPPVPELLDELASLKTLTADFFVRERGLSSKGLNPKNSTEMLFITPEKIEEVWGKCTAFKTTNTTLKPETRSQLLDLYSKIYGKVDVTNKEFMLWLVKGNITEQMGFEVDSASVAASTVYVLACRLESDLLKRKLTAEETETLARLAPTLSSKPSRSQLRYSIRSNGVREEGEHKPFLGFGSRRISPDDITNAEEVLLVEAKLLATMEKKELFLENSRKSIVEKIIGFKFGVDDRKADVEEATQNVNVTEEGLKSNDSLINKVQSVIQQFKDNCNEENDGFVIALKRLEGLRSERDSLIRKLEFAKLTLQESERRAKKAKDLYEEASLDMMNFEVDIGVVCQELTDVRRHKDAVADEIEKMRNGLGVACWPKPCLHPDRLEDEGGLLELKPCSFCNKWYNSFDAVISSCKHLYHPFYISKLLDTQDSCVSCNKPFDPSWLTSFGFKPIRSPTEDNDMKLEMLKSEMELPNTPKNSFGVSIHERSQSRGKHLDWGSSGSIYQAQPTLPYTSNNKLTEKTKSGENIEGAKNLGSHGTDEVDSPVKDLMAHEKTKLGDVDNTVVLPRIDQIALLPIVNDEDAAVEPIGVSTAKESLKQSQDSSEARKEDMQRSSEACIPQRGNGEISQDSGCLRRALNPAIHDVIMKKKVSILALSNEANEKEKSGRALTNMKRGQKRDCKKVDLQ